MSGKIDGTVFRNSPNLKNACRLDDDLICLLFIVSSIKQIITVACGVRQPESVQTLLQKWKKKNAQLALELSIYCWTERKKILSEQESFCFYLSISEGQIVQKYRN